MGSIKKIIEFIREENSPTDWSEGIDPTKVLVGPSSLHKSRSGLVTFSTKKDLAETKKAWNEKPGLLIAGGSQSFNELLQEDVAYVLVKNPRLTFIKVLNEFFPPALCEWRSKFFNFGHRRDPTAVVHPSAVIHSSVVIGPHVSIGKDCLVGSGSVIHPNVVLYPRTIVGERVVIHAGSVIGADGFGPERDEQGILHNFPHFGRVFIKDDVIIGSNTSVDRGALDATTIGNRVMIDNQVHIAHNVVIDDDTAVVAMSVVAGSVKIGRRCWIAPTTCIKNQVTIGDDVSTGLATVITKDVPDGETIVGSPARPLTEFLRERVALKNLFNHS